ncbi:MAG: hypothetical protein NTX81_07195 [Candidatus Bathyarchaeota archaeon]|nr:hypothetical protein [Candidatus Bathyarchaeota archaeon]
MTLRDFAKLAVRKRTSNVRNASVTSALPTGAKKEDTQDKYNDYENPPASQGPDSTDRNSYTGGELK